MKEKQSKIQILYLMSVAFILLLQIKPVNGQSADYPFQKPAYKFIRYDLNRLQFGKDSSQFENFFMKLDRLIHNGEGNINIVHIGGSHVQADIHSGELRRRLQMFYPGNKGSRGFLFPYKMAKTNNPGNFSMNYTGRWTACRNVQANYCTLGLSGISVTTTDTISSITLYPSQSNYMEYDYNRVRIFHQTTADSYSIEFGNPEAVASAYVNPDGGYTEFKLNRHLNELNLLIRKTAPEQQSFTLYGIQFINDDPGITYHSIGVNGAAVPSYLKCVLLAKHLKVIDPDLIILSIGVNDAHGKNFSADAFRVNYESLIQMMKPALKDATVLFTTNNDTYLSRKYPNRNALQVREVMFQLAEKYGYGVWDLHSIMGGLGSMSTWEREGLAASDRVHFTRAGYTLIGDLMFEAILKSYVNHLKSLKD